MHFLCPCYTNSLSGLPPVMSLLPLPHHRTFRPWLSTTSDCAQLRTGFGRNLSTTGLVSLPSSGNSWLRFLIEGGSGIFTGSLYSDLTIIKTGEKQVSTSSR